MQLMLRRGSRFRLDLGVARFDSGLGVLWSSLDTCPDDIGELVEGTGDCIFCFCSF